MIGNSHVSISTEEDRDAHRYRRALLSICANALSKSAALLSLVVSVPLTLNYLGPERFGVWMTIAGILSLLSIADLGMGNALVSETARLAVRPNRDALRRFLSNSLFILSLIGVTVAVLLFAVISAAPVTRMFKNIPANLEPEIRLSFFTVGMLFAAGIPLQAVQKIAAGLQRAYVSHAIATVASLVSLLLIILLANLEAPIPALICATYGVHLLACAILLAILIRGGELATIGTAVSLRNTARRLIKTGWIFLLLQIAVLAGWGMDNLLIAALIGATEVATLAIVQRLFDFVAQPLAIVNAPLWASYADANARRDTNFIRKTLCRSLMITVVASSLLAFALVAAIDYILAAWLNSKIAAPGHLVTAYATWVIVASTGGALAMYLNGVGILREQAILTVPFVILVTIAKVIAVNHLGVTGIPLASLVVYLLVVILPLVTIFRRALIAPLKP